MTTGHDGLIEDAERCLVVSLWKRNIFKFGLATKVDRRAWEYRLWPTEKRLLSVMVNSRPMNKYSLAKSALLHYTQVVRATKSLLARRAIAIHGKPKKWRTGKTSETYNLTSFGKFLYLFAVTGKNDVDRKALFRSLLDLSEFWSNPVLSKLAKSADRIQDEEKRKLHLGWLGFLAFNMQNRIEKRKLELAARFFGFWTDLEDIQPYLWIPECNWLISEAIMSITAQVETFSRSLPKLQPHDARRVEEQLELEKQFAQPARERWDSDSRYLTRFSRSPPYTGPITEAG